MSDESTPAFQTERTRKFRAGELNEADERTISHIEEFGCSILTVARSSESSGQNWSYTIGVYDTSGKPEIITVGLQPSTAQHLLDEAQHACAKAWT